MNPLAIPLPAVLPHPTDTRASPEFPLRLGGGKREAPPLPKGPSELGEANTGPRSLPPRVSRQKTQYQLQAGARGGAGRSAEGRGRGQGSACAPRVPGCSTATKRGRGEREGVGRGRGDPARSSPLTPRRQAASLPTLGPSERAQARKPAASAPKEPEEPNKMATPPSPLLLLPPLPARGAGAHTRPPPETRRRKRNQKPCGKATRPAGDAPSPPRAPPTYRLKPCPRTRAPAAKQQSSRRLRGDAARTEPPRLPRPP